VNAEGKSTRLRNIESVTCHRCKKKGHCANKCDNERVDDEGNGEHKTIAARKQIGTTLLTDGDVYDVNFLNDQNEPTNYEFVNMKLMKEDKGIVMQIEGNGKLPKDWILLYNQSTVDVFATKSCCPTFANIPAQWTFTVTLELQVEDLSANSADMEPFGIILRVLRTFFHLQKPRIEDTG
jgi:hypothetical protein